MIIIAFAIFNVLEAGNGSDYYGRSYNPPPILISPLKIRHFQRPPDIFLRLSPANRACSDFRSRRPTFSLSVWSCFTAGVLYAFILMLTLFDYIYIRLKHFTAEKLPWNKISRRHNCITPHSRFNDLSDPLKEQIRPSEETSDKNFITLRTFVVQANPPRNLYSRTACRGII